MNASQKLAALAWQGVLGLGAPAPAASGAARRGRTPPRPARARAAQEVAEGEEGIDEVLDQAIQEADRERAQGVAVPPGAGGKRRPTRAERNRKARAAKADAAAGSGDPGGRDLPAGAVNDVDAGQVSTNGDNPDKVSVLRYKTRELEADKAGLLDMKREREIPLQDMMKELEADQAELLEMERERDLLLQELRLDEGAGTSC